MPDPEIEAMSRIAAALSELDDAEVRSRILRWAAERYGVTLSHASRGSGDAARDGESDVYSDGQDGVGHDEGAARHGPANGDSTPNGQFEHFADLFDAVKPKTNLEKAMTAAFWEQEISGRKDWQSLTVNRHLRDLGHYDVSINRTLSSGIQAKPALVLQLKKTGSAQQGRKTYKLSSEGLKYVRTKIAHTS
jgi:hypothetical protein